MRAAVLDSVRPTFRAVARVIVPEAGALPAEGWSALEETVEWALASRPPAMRKQLVTFLRLIEWLPLARYGARFSGLSPARGTAFLRSLERSPVLLIRRGLWGLRTLVMMGYYTQSSIQTAIGYRAHADGWSARRRSGEYPALSVPNGSAR